MANVMLRARKAIPRLLNQEALKGLTTASL